jgi:hypothetical protein
MNSGFRKYSTNWGYLSIHGANGGSGSNGVMGEFFRSGAILVMGLIVIGAGIFVVFHHTMIG